ncbi:MAG: hypothetical protein AB2L07_09765 [Thermoanaerobaculaceae bacterium]
MNPDDPVRTLLGGLERPAPPAELEGRTLAAAARALAERTAPDLWERLWSNHVLRLAWATAVLALAAGHVALSVYQRVATRPAATATRPELPPEVARIAALPPIDLSNLPGEPGAQPAPAAGTQKETRQ